MRKSVVVLLVSLMSAAASAQTNCPCDSKFESITSKSTSCHTVSTEFTNTTDGQCVFLVIDTPGIICLDGTMDPCRFVFSVEVKKAQNPPDCCTGSIVRLDVSTQPIKKNCKPNGAATAAPTVTLGLPFKHESTAANPFEIDCGKKATSKITQYSNCGGTAVPVVLVGFSILCCRCITVEGH